MVPGVATAGGTYQYRTHIRGGQAELDIPGKQRAAEELPVLSCTKQISLLPQTVWAQGLCGTVQAAVPTSLPSHVSGISLPPWGRSYICNAQTLKKPSPERFACPLPAVTGAVPPGPCRAEGVITLWLPQR